MKTFIIAMRYEDPLKSRTYCGPSQGFSRTGWDAMFFDTYADAQEYIDDHGWSDDDTITIEEADTMDT